MLFRLRKGLLDLGLSMVSVKHSRVREPKDATDRAAQASISKGIGPPPTKVATSCARVERQTRIVMVFSQSAASACAETFPGQSGSSAGFISHDERVCHRMGIC